MFFATFLDAAPGKTSNEFKIKSPTQEIAIVTTTAIAVVKTVWVIPTEIPREAANWGCKDANVIVLDKNIQNTTIESLL